MASEADQIQAYLAPASQALGQFAAFAASPQLKTLEAEVLADVNKLNLILNKNLRRPDLRLLTSYNVAGLGPRLEGRTS